MIYRTTPKFVIKISERIEKNLIKIELALVSLALIGGLIETFQKNIGNLIVTNSLVTLALAYYFLAFKPADNTYDKFMVKLINLSYTSSIISFLFVILNWPGGLMMHQMSLIALLISLVFLVFLGKALKKTSVIDTTKVIRTFIVLGLLLSLFFSPGYKALKETQNELEIEFQDAN